MRANSYVQTTFYKLASKHAICLKPFTVESESHLFLVAVLNVILCVFLTESHLFLVAVLNVILCVFLIYC